MMSTEEWRDIARFHLFDDEATFFALLNPLNVVLGEQLLIVDGLGRTLAGYPRTGCPHPSPTCFLLPAAPRWWCCGDDVHPVHAAASAIWSRWGCGNAVAVHPIGDPLRFLSRHVVNVDLSGLSATTPNCPWFRRGPEQDGPMLFSKRFLHRWCRGFTSTMWSARRCFCRRVNSAMAGSRRPEGSSSLRSSQAITGTFPLGIGSMSWCVMTSTVVARPLQRPVPWIRSTFPEYPRRKTAALLALLAVRTGHRRGGRRKGPAGVRRAKSNDAYRLMVDEVVVL